MHTNNFAASALLPMGLLEKSTHYITWDSFEGEKFRENAKNADFADKTFADLYYRPDMGCACMQSLRRKLSRMRQDP